MTEIRSAAKKAVMELIEKASLKKGDILVVGCSSSEIVGQTIGNGSSLDAAQAVFDEIYPVLKEKGIFLAAQCCEHLNRAVIVEKECAKENRLEIVNVVPQPKAGGSFATAAYMHFEEPVAVEFIKGDAGMDIGLTFIGMHLKHVAVPLRLSVNKIGEATVTFARTRPKCIGGQRAAYNETIM